VSDVDVIIIGAGAAGIAAARWCQTAGVSYQLLEARARIGGRALTLDFAGIPLDLGCGWLHSADRNPLVEQAQALGFEIDRALPPWQKTMVDAGFSLGDQQDFRREQQAFYARLAAGAQLERDYPAAYFLEPEQRWSALIDAISTYVNGTELDHLSTHDFCAYDDTEVNWRLPRGYGRLFATLADGLAIKLNCGVQHIDHGGRDIKITSGCGNLTSRAVIVCVPSSILARGDITFAPALPEHMDAAHVLPLGIADKVYLRLDHADEFPINGRLVGATDRRDKGSYHLRPFGRDLIEGYFGGAYALALEEIIACLGSGMRQRLHFVTATAWGRDPYAAGSYSHALPGHASARATLAQAIDQRLFFAGEAVSPHDFSTAHGAWMTGLEAAQSAVQAMVKS
jgi:monoamine oxidase